VALTLAALTGSELTPAMSSPDFTSSCDLTNSNTMLECTLAPAPGPGWTGVNSTNPLTLRIRLQSIAGHVATTLVTYTGGPGASAQGVLSSGTGFGPGVGNANPLYLVAQLFRNTTHQVPLQVNDALTLGSYTLTKAAFSPGFAAACGLTNMDTMLECVLTPDPGLIWSAGGPLVIRVRLVADDGSTNTTTLQFRIG
jgi:hypothetical protein